MLHLECSDDNCDGIIKIEHIFQYLDSVECPVCNMKYSYEYNEDSNGDMWPMLYPKE